jgi:hypothetical protein
MNEPTGTSVLLPCPICRHREAGLSSSNFCFDCGKLVRCDGCGVTTCLCAWQAFPRQSSAVMDVVGEMWEHAQLIDELDAHTTPNMLTRWCKRLSQSVSAPSPSAKELADELRRFAGDRDWEHHDGTPADLRGIADRLSRIADKGECESPPDRCGCGNYRTAGSGLCDDCYVRKAWATETAKQRTP